MVKGVYPSSWYPGYKHTVSEESWKRISEYIDEAYHDGGHQYLVTIKVPSWKRMVSVLCAIENHIPQEGFDALLQDYHAYWEASND